MWMSGSVSLLLPALGWGLQEEVLFESTNICARRQWASPNTFSPGKLLLDCRTHPNLTSQSTQSHPASLSPRQICPFLLQCLLPGDPTLFLAHPCTSLDFAPSAEHSCLPAPPGQDPWQIPAQLLVSNPSTASEPPPRRGSARQSHNKTSIEHLPPEGSSVGQCQPLCDPRMSVSSGNARANLMGIGGRSGHGEEATFIPVQSDW